MTIPFVIDNQQHKMADVLNALLADHKGHSLDIATAYFNISGWQLLHDGLNGLGNFRLLLGDEPEVGSDLGLREVGAKPIKGLISDLAKETFNEKTLRLVEDLIAFLRQEHVQVRLYTRGFLHAKCYIFYSGGGFERFTPIAAIVGSSNFTRPGLQTNKELNLAHRANLSPREVEPGRVKSFLESADLKRLEQLDEVERVTAANVPGVLAINDLAEWYERQWEAARDFKNELLDLVDSSKFGRKEYTPYQVYMKAIFEYFRDDLENGSDTETRVRSAVELSEFQEDAVKKARKILASYDGVMVADSVGLGKTWIGKKLLEDYAYHQRYKAVVICPAALQKMWHDELLGAGIAARIITQEVMGRDEFDGSDAWDADIVLVDESHNFRNRNAHRYENLERILAANNRRGKISGERKKLILLTATPINNTVFDLYNQVNLFTGGDRSYFAAAGIGDLNRYFQVARRVNQQQESGIALFNLLEEVVIRRTRPFIKEAYPNATIKGQPISWPERRLKTIRYDLEATYGGIYDKLVNRIEGLKLAPYRLETYKKQGIIRDQFEEGREEALVGIFKSRYLKRFESSIDAFRISIRRALEFLETFESYILDDKVLNSASFQKAMRFLAREDEEDDATPSSLSEQLDSDDPAAVQWRASAGEPRIRRMDSGADARERARLVAQFAPHANNKPEIAGSDNEIDILISTDVLSEGQNLQDCGVLINYDLHWNPTRMVQRAGRIDRIGT